MQTKPTGGPLSNGTYEIRQFIRVEGEDILEIVEQHNIETGKSHFSSSITIVGPAGPLGTASFPLPGETLDEAFIALVPTREEVMKNLENKARSRIVVPTKQVPGLGGPDD